MVFLCDICRLHKRKKLGNTLQLIPVYPFTMHKGAIYLATRKEDQDLEEKLHVLTDDSLDIGTAYANFG